MLDEGDERGRHGDDLLSGDVHQLHFFGSHEVDLRRSRRGTVRTTHAQTGTRRPATHEHALGVHATVFVDVGVGLSDNETLFLVGGEVADLTGHPTVLDHAVGRLNEAVLVDLGVVREVPDKSDVRTFGRLDGTHTSVVGGVHVTNLEARTLP